MLTVTAASPNPSALGDDERAALVEEIGLLWEEFGMLRMDGRVTGYLMLSNAPHVSTAELRDALRASAGSISTTTRRLKEFGFIRQVAVAGERSHFFRADDDVWGAFLAAESKAYIRAREFAEHVLHVLGNDDEHPRTRFQNMRDYHEWLESHHRLLYERWEEFKRGRGGG
jgi:DNA-binding transcriptional regulator GbsR (MarR family)